MAKQPYKLPNVFVGCPYSKKFKFKLFKQTLERVPFRFHFADTQLHTKHLLGILRSYISSADYCLFDVSLWNANVSLELGLADGLEAPYYILLNGKLSSGVPSDIQGIQRIEYSSFDDFDEDKGLYPKLIRFLVKDQTHPRNIWDALGGQNKQTKYHVAMRILAHLRDHKRLSPDDLKHAAQGSYLRATEQESILETLSSLGLLSNIQSKKGATLKKNLFKDPLKIG